MRPALASAVVLLALTGCGADSDSPAPSTPTPSAPRSSSTAPPTSSLAPTPSPSVDVLDALAADCSQAQPILTEVNDAAAEAGDRVITTTDAAEVFRAKQAELEALAQQSSNAGFTGAAGVVADNVGMVRVAVLQGRDVGATVNGYLETVRVLVAICQG